MSTKQKFVRGRGPSNINLGIFVCYFDVCRASSIPSINYGSTRSYQPSYRDNWELPNLTTNMAAGDLLCFRHV